jgi:hypothetical protein
MAFIRAEGRQDRAVMVSDYRLYVATIHSCNTDDYSKYSSSSYWAPWAGDIREIMGADLDIYRSLQQSRTGVFLPRPADNDLVADLA